ncbi:hypothetical protein M758_12G131000 [Ceratodon purpureus]|nr:hypothetical protein M758_12G131000 [Ceratodon purpureus]
MLGVSLLMVCYCEVFVICTQVNMCNEGRLGLLLGKVLKGSIIFFETDVQTCRFCPVRRNSVNLDSMISFL